MKTVNLENFPELLSLPVGESVNVSFKLKALESPWPIDSKCHLCVFNSCDCFTIPCTCRTRYDQKNVYYVIDLE